MWQQVIDFLTTASTWVLTGALMALTLTALWAIPAHRRDDFGVAFARCVPAGAALPIAVLAGWVRHGSGWFLQPTAASAVLTVLTLLSFWLMGVTALCSLSFMLAGPITLPSDSLPADAEEHVDEHVEERVDYVLSIDEAHDRDAVDKLLEDLLPVIERVAGTDVLLSSRSYGSGEADPVAGCPTPSQ